MSKLNYIKAILAIILFLSSNILFAQQSTKKFDITFQLILEIKNRNKACLPCGRIGNAIIDSINQQIGVSHCNRVRLSKKNAAYKYFIKFSTYPNLETIIKIYEQSLQMKNITIY